MDEKEAKYKRRRERVKETMEVQKKSKVGGKNYSQANAQLNAKQPSLIKVI